MNSRRKKRSKASAALVALRKAMGKTQQQFAVEDLRGAIVTVARYETSQPPRGDALFNLADIAQKNGQPEIAEAFEVAWLKDMFEKFVDRRSGRTQGAWSQFCSIANRTIKSEVDA